MIVSLIKWREVNVHVRFLCILELSNQQAIARFVLHFDWIYHFDWGIRSERHYIVPQTETDYLNMSGSGSMSGLGRTLALFAIPAVAASLYVLYRKKLIFTLKKLKRKNSFKIVEDRSTASIVENRSIGSLDKSWNCLGLEQPLVIVCQFLLSPSL